MAKRFGRNQRRKLQQELYRTQFLLADAQRALDTSWRMRNAAEARAEKAVNDAFQRFMADRGLVEHYLEIIAKTLGGALAEGIKPAAEQILRSRRDLPAFDARASYGGLKERSVIILRGRIPAIDYNIAMT